MKTSPFKLYALFTIILLSAGLVSCHKRSIKGSGHQITESHKVSEFDRIEVSGGYKVNVKQDSSFNVTITTDDNLMKYINTEVSGGQLHIYSKKRIYSRKGITVNVGVRQLTEFRAAGAVDLQSAGHLNIQDLRLNLSGVSKITLDLNADSITTQGSGATVMHLKGRAIAQRVHFSGMGRLFAYDCVTDNYDVHASGASECELNVLRSLTVNTSGASEISYKGTPGTLNIHKSGIASVKKVN